MSGATVYLKKVVGLGLVSLVGVLQSFHLSRHVFAARLDGHPYTHQVTVVQNLLHVYQSHSGTINSTITTHQSAFINNISDNIAKFNLCNTQHKNVLRSISDCYGRVLYTKT